MSERVEGSDWVGSGSVTDDSGVEELLLTLPLAADQMNVVVILGGLAKLELMLGQLTPEQHLMTTLTDCPSFHKDGRCVFSII